MGEMADEIIDQMFGEEGPWFWEPAPPTCKRCQSQKVYWVEIEGNHNTKRWRLMDAKTHRLHVCNPVKLSEIPDL